MIVARGF
ncbi:hypothetical protein VCHC41B1_1090A, partial [Vibrio cholerae HC-41B1]